MHQFTSHELFNQFIISVRKLLDADWLKSAQLFHQLYGSIINDFANGGKLLKNEEIAPEELKAKGLTNKSTKF